MGRVVDEVGADDHLRQDLPLDSDRAVPYVRRDRARREDVHVERELRVSDEVLKVGERFPLKRIFGEVGIAVVVEEVSVALPRGDQEGKG